ncbi:hypothetical protein SAZ11_05845 [Streptomyces sp. FXJ1.4098]|nr:hypothetical protein [Streptomyces sp. FXJ1.4098]
MIPRNPASAAHQSGRERVLLEAFGNMGWQVAPAFAHALLGAAAARGVNLTVLHALWTDETRVYFPPPFGPRAPWWWAMRPLADWTGRVMESVRGTSAARTALIQPQRAAEQWRGTDQGTALDTAFGAAARALESAQTDFDLVHEGALSGDRGLRDHARTDGGTLAVGHARYEVAVLPNTPVLDAATARTLAEFARGGGTVLAVGELPDQEAGGDDAALRRALRALFPSRPRAAAGSAGAGPCGSRTPPAWARRPVPRAPRQPCSIPPPPRCWCCAPPPAGTRPSCSTTRARKPSSPTWCSRSAGHRSCATRSPARSPPPPSTSRPAGPAPRPPGCRCACARTRRWPWCSARAPRPAPI